MKILLTGGTSGIGREVALALGANGHQVDVVGGMNKQKGQALAHKFENLPGDLRFYPVDLSDPATIRNFAQEYLASNTHLDVLFANAGMYVQQASHGPSGLERGFVVNYLHKFMMLVLMHPLLASSEGQCVINGSSNFARPLKLDPSIFAKQYKNMDGMMQATYANAYLTYWFNRQYQTKVPVQSVNPGFVKTGMMDKANFLVRFAQSLFAITPEKAATTIVPVLEGKTHKGEDATYIDQGKSKDFSKKIKNDPATFQKLWSLSLELAGIDGNF